MLPGLILLNIRVSRVHSEHVCDGLHTSRLDDAWAKKKLFRGQHPLSTSLVPPPRLYEGDDGNRVPPSLPGPPIGKSQGSDESPHGASGGAQSSLQGRSPQ